MAAVHSAKEYLLFHGSIVKAQVKKKKARIRLNVYKVLYEPNLSLVKPQNTRPVALAIEAAEPTYMMHAQMKWEE